MKPGNEEALLAGLKALADSVAEDAPAASIEAALRREFRRHGKLRNRSNFANLSSKYFKYILLGTAAAVLTGVFLTDRQPPPPIQTKALRPPAAMQHLPEVVAVPARQASAKARRRPATPNREVTTEFFAVPYAPQFTSEDRGQLVRVRLPRESMRSFGLPVNEDRVTPVVNADVLVGEDGVARAIRFVRY